MPGSIWWGVSAVSGGGHNLAYLGGLQLLRFEARRHAGQLVRVALAFLGEGRLLLLVPGEGGVHHAPAVHLPCTCRAPAVHVLCTSTCYAQARAMHMPCICRAHAYAHAHAHAHAMHMLCTCYAHAVHMLCTCYAYMPCKGYALLCAPHAQAVPLRRHLSVPLRLLLCPAPLYPCERLELLQFAPLLMQRLV